jgi:hypothetical protein
MRKLKCVSDLPATWCKICGKRIEDAWVHAAETKHKDFERHYEVLRIPFSTEFSVVL